MAGEIKITINGLSDLTSALDAVKARLDIATRQATIEAAQRLQSNAVSNFNVAPAPTTRTGNLQRSIKSSPVMQQGIGKYTIKVGPTAIYARIIELGGTITPKEAKMLSWISGGKRVFAHSVTIRPHPYFEPAYVRTVGQLRPIFESAWRKALEA